MQRLNFELDREYNYLGELVEWKLVMEEATGKMMGISNKFFFFFERISNKLVLTYFLS